MATLSVDKPQDIKLFWEKAEKSKEEILNIPDETIVKKSNSLMRATRYYTIPQFNRENLKKTRFTGWCGPAAMAWVYRGLYDSYKGKYIPLHGENSTFEYQLHLQSGFNTSYYSSTCEIYTDMEKESRTLSGLIKGATLPNDFDAAVYRFFPNKKINRHKGEIKGAPRRSIQAGNPIYMVVFAGGGSLHYIVGFGTKDKYGWFGIHSDSWIYVTDNGTNIGSHNYEPYYRNSNFFNLSNKYTHMGEFVQK